MNIKSTILKTAVLFAFYSGGLVFGQSVKGDRNAGFSHPSAEELAKAGGIERCSSTEYEAFLQKHFPGRMTADQFEAWLAPLVEKERNNSNKSQNGNIVTIPVVVHVIHAGQAYGAAPNIVDEQVQSQITVMNNDFRRIAGTPGFNSNAIGADTQIQFALAKVDPNGNPTNGINRVNLCQASWSQTQINSFVKPETIWDPTLYMNMWSVQFSSSGLLGYAQFPSGSGLAGLNAVGGEAYTDGVVANYSTFGSSDYNNGSFILGAPYDKGRTMTHEVGHFMGLRHIWGDATCGDDFCADTPTAHTSNYTCNPNIASCTVPSVFEMVQNYMDYTNDTCMNIYTINQKDRITAVMNNSPRRVELKTSTKDIAIPLFPNDAEVKLERDCTTLSCTTATAQNVKVSLYNRGNTTMTSAVITYTVNNLSQTFNWTGSLAQDKYAIVTLPMPTNALGGYMNIAVNTVNGVADQRASNSNIFVDYMGAPTRLNESVVFNLQRDQYGSETSWELKNSAGITVYSGGPYTDAVNPPLITQNWTLNANECYTFVISDSYGDGFYPYGGYYNIKSTTGSTLVTGSHFASSQTKYFKIQTLGTAEAVKRTFGIYPNPATDVLNVTNLSDNAKYEIHNAVGQLVKKGNVENEQIRVAEFVKGIYVITIIDKDLKETLKFIKK
ncbi:Por secretion system C-terminal sorting domain-containing protein [Chryseobacterium piscicola]|jgi:hypothetical protein|uniref:Por secretion system C-terminal sorting domain-containing protein n=1 Tax=Chryseobacterium piscicola TaxID=551459 RepID=A0A1N7N9M1_9FLAO|nr:M43 family zinc metalloprotease [Chryseobacterium piscicola]PQA92260.1 hypothetical protein B0A70_11610 [Chryseobacterium piscicola]SIS95030.1 Por secretion system C-terminal sorting domain-containing protein [Chryseobacterium piscicola]